jgi:hypothetical protein
MITQTFSPEAHARLRAALAAQAARFAASPAPSAVHTEHRSVTPAAPAPPAVHAEHRSVTPAVAATEADARFVSEWRDAHPATFEQAMAGAAGSPIVKACEAIAARAQQQIRACQTRGASMRVASTFAGATDPLAATFEAAMRAAGDTPVVCACEAIAART